MAIYSSNLTVWLIIANNESCLNYMLPENMQVGHG